MIGRTNTGGGGADNQGYITSIGYSGNTSVIENDDKVWEVALLTSGTLNVYKQVAVDIFLRGGGGGGGHGLYVGGLGGGRDSGSYMVGGKGGTGVIRIRTHR